MTTAHHAGSVTSSDGARGDVTTPDRPAVGHSVVSGVHVGFSRVRVLATDDTGMSTVEYAIGTLAAAAFAAILYAVVKGDTIVTALTDLIGRALSGTFG